MADAGFNGTVVIFGTNTSVTSVTNLIGVSYSRRAAAVDVSVQNTNNSKTYVNGQTDKECVLRLRGAPNTNIIAIGTTGLLTVKYYDNTSYQATANCIVNAIDATGDLDGDIGYSVVLKPQS